MKGTLNGGGGGAILNGMTQCEIFIDMTDNADAYISATCKWLFCCAGFWISRLNDHSFENSWDRVERMGAKV
jgi:hypothetical protein